MKPSYEELENRIISLEKFLNAGQSSEINKMTPVIALSAHVVAGERKKCIEAGMSDFISKPIDVEAFRNILLKYLNRIKTDEF